MSGPELRRHGSVDFGRFFKSWIQNPRAIGAFAPSGRVLAKLMATNLGAGARVLELGAGTGTVTQAILETGVRPQDLYVVEQNSQFAKILYRRFPACRILEADATQIVDCIDGARGSFDFVISSLPLLLFSPEQKARVLSQALQALKPDGRLHQYTYAGRCPVGRHLRSRLRLESSLIGFAPFNLPPAFVYRFTQA
jgi:phospholipid N-methyltransferase